MVPETASAEKCRQQVSDSIGKWIDHCREKREKKALGLFYEEIGRKISYKKKNCF